MQTIHVALGVGASIAIATFGLSANAQVTPASPTSAAQTTAPTVAPASVGLPQTMVIPLKPGDVSTSSAGLPLDLALLPLRLSLASPTWSGEKALPGCRDKSEENGNTEHYLPLSRAAAIHLIPNLTLTGFSLTGCPVDAVVGVGLVYTTPIRKNLWLVGSVGTTMLPTTTYRQPTPGANARVDLVWQATPTSALTFGINRRGVMVGGAF